MLYSLDRKRTLEFAIFETARKASKKGDKTYTGRALFRILLKH